jgi:hypothetical protein
VRREARRHIPRFNRETLEEMCWATSLPAVERPTGQQHAGIRLIR